jgi:hypothetical protein
VVRPERNTRFSWQKHLENARKHLITYGACAATGSECCNRKGVLHRIKIKYFYMRKQTKKQQKG